MTSNLPDLEMPQVSINGTSVDALVEQQSAIATALAQVLHLMALARPHGRDYQYVPGEFVKAQNAWAHREQMLDDLRQEIVEHALAIQRTEG